MNVSKRERWIAIAAGAVLLLYVLDQLLVTPTLDRWDRAEARLARAEAQLAQARQVMQNDLRARRQWNEMAGDSLQSSAPDAESQLLNRVRDWAQEAGLSLNSLRPERSDQVQGFHRITIRAAGVGTMRQVARFLYAVQTADVPVRVGDVQMTARTDGEDDLSFQVGLATLYLPGEAAAGPAEVVR